MSEQIVRHEQFEYTKENPFQILNIIHTKDSETGSEALQHHWHSELEICHIMEGNLSTHVVDGQQISDKEGSVIVVNSDSIHNIIDNYDDVGMNHIGATVLIISRDFLKEAIPEFESMYFVPISEMGNKEMGQIMRKLSAYGNHPDEEKNIQPYEYLYIRGLVYELLHYLIKYRLSWRSVEMPINKAKNLERIKGAISYIENHYKEPLSQEEIAGKFYFSSGYFSRCFHKAMHMTFVEYVARYRSQQARHMLIGSDKTIMDIALDCGFTDSRRFIVSFKKIYGVTPLQYRKIEQNVKKR